MGVPADKLTQHPPTPLPVSPPVSGSMTPQEMALLEYHRNNLRNRTYIDDEQGMTTVNITGVNGPDGNIYNVPGFADGKRLSEQEAAQRAASMGWGQFPAYPNNTSVPRDQHPANVAARAMHEQIDRDASAFRKWRAQ